MITAAEAHLLNPKSHALDDEIRQIGYAIEEASKEGKFILKWTPIDSSLSRIDIRMFLMKLGYSVFTQDLESLTISW